MKYVLIMTLCSAINNTCVEPRTVNYFNTWKDCALNGYEKSLELLNELSDETFENKRSYTRFVCRINTTI